MICPKCAREIPDDAMICCYCGRHIIIQRGSGKKRGNGEGNAYKRGNTWTVRVSQPSTTDENGKLHRHRPTKGGFKTKGEALAYAETLKNGPLSVPDVSMEKVFTEWSKGYSARVGASTMAGYKAAMKHYSEISSRAIKTIRPAELQAQINDCKKGKRTKQLMKVVAGLIWKFAMDNDMVERDITRNLYTGNDPTETRAPFTDLELKRIRNAVGTEPYAEYVLALCYTGFRPGELLELKKSAYNKKGKYLIGGGKTEAGTDRIVTIPPAIADIITQRAEADGEMLFPNLSTGKQMTHEYFRKYCFDPLMAKLGITGKVPYSCRHTYSNLLKNAPGDTGDKARLMGHADYTFTQEKYQSSTVKDLKKITNRLK
jgi:integrase